MIYITSSELNVTKYDRMIDNCTFPYRNENILIFKKVLAVDHQFPPTILLAKLTSPCGFLFISSLRLILLF